VGEGGAKRRMRGSEARDGRYKGSGKNYAA
jgi:hypothetical protein